MVKKCKPFHYPRIEGNKIICLRCLNLESDLYSKFRPEIIFPATRNKKKVNVKFYRKDTFENEKEFVKYLRLHFKILEKEIKELEKNETKN